MPLPPSSRGRPAGTTADQTQQRIIAAAIRCVAEVGCSGATIRQIATAAEMTSGSLYHHFPNKADLLAEAVATARGIALPRLHAAARRSGNVVDRLVAVLDEADRLVRDHPHLAAFDRATGEVPPLRDVIGEILTEAKHGGALASGVGAEAAADAVYALTRGLTEQKAQLSPAAYRATLRCAADLLRGTLF
ncbi:TetR/AcrR family transcriptional regulator [Mycolicibacter terrae]|uniref:TetR/AcrR family transcriptional regulator n=1 Tax=Mycolicibacter terrae TaxID=1788 RepID=UPI000A15A54E|nr:TetR family transcriptional regulator [Mycolicibacter terrae]ORW89648.1 TetR family transcriptional regulator [Mycolicibacter terrae]SNV82590.1 transcriptional regulatory protein (possibly TetR-family) [Mycolicibacter terrae]